MIYVLAHKQSRPMSLPWPSGRQPALSFEALRVSFTHPPGKRPELLRQLQSLSCTIPNNWHGSSIERRKPRMLKVNPYWTPPWSSLAAAWECQFSFQSQLLSFWLEAGLKPANIIGLSVPDVMGDRSGFIVSILQQLGWKRTGSLRVK